ncbi:Asp-tRNA(Asn)/Glu-tRNA(Gln) amidotransferase GatCAB subunit C [Candidatus Falkowbacteria bacterium HGW-Falkowbacteria-1]|jgi:aspartyl-tRNA(Asn)/glutamyl-tRNA(Gln) amidotransferase subunit C|uniref:Asp-tRNA(Asn)/Glu-tRNA(Gln) amidotransferase GatCAB subunit C n=1 Tax=Candidatus Falkowbacteria bacterium HGW-Falkowbacteria-1 TaxID=2013768 RepID=A0A2N2EAT0_9BACT|nr:MAG: Asp-tRNA(Asn)/Glu-tRNA(Gln) amidotransferase GatCAB subunit C [Candidatus Falkowbacteria bacterium HGW-Falkowbacteria-1]
MEISKNEIEKIAFLARLDLNEVEKEKYQIQLANILNFVDSLKELDVSNSEVLGLANDFENQLREDEVVDCDQEEREIAIGQSAEREAGQIKVKRVL